MRRLFCFIYVHLVNLVVGAPTFHELLTPTYDELSYMKRYGYLAQAEGLELAYTPQSITTAVIKLQAFAGIPQTGVMDEKTKQLIKKRRCGLPDIRSSNTTRVKRYAVQKPWSKRTITFRVLNATSRATMTKARIEKVMAEVLGIWAPYGGLRFVKVDQGSADIEISFRTGAHGDMLPFDGPGGVLAHAFFPPTGQIHFDDEEYWVSSQDDFEDEFNDETDFKASALHEAGHSLGMDHSPVLTSVMYPFYQGTYTLDDDDILGMYELYMKDGPRETASKTRLTITTPTEESNEADDIPDICFCNYDTIQVLQGKIFVFEDEWVWVLERKKVVADGYPKKYHDVFVGLPKHVEPIRAVYEKQDGNIVIFAGRGYWMFNSTFHIVNSGDVSLYKLPHNVRQISTVFLSNYNNKTYLIDDERFWRFDDRNGKMDNNYPKSMASWSEVPYPVDAALVWEGDTYFFQGGQFWRFDNRVVRAHAYYPQPVAPIWFPCEFRDDLAPSPTRGRRNG